MKKTASTDLRQFIREEAQKLYKITMLEEQKKSAELELKILNEEFEGEQEQEDIDEMQDIPDVENDCFISTTPFNGYGLACGGKFMGNHEEVEDCLRIVKSWMEDSNFTPNIWFVSDHGNFSPIDIKGNIIKETKGVNAMYKNAGMTPPEGKGIHTKKFHKCVTSVGEKGDVDNPYAVCMSSLGKEKAVKAAHRTDENAIPFDMDNRNWAAIADMDLPIEDIIDEAQTALDNGEIDEMDYNKIMNFLEKKYDVSLPMKTPHFNNSLSEDSTDNKTLTYDEVFNIAENAGKIVLDAQTALYSLLVGFEEDETIPKDRVLRILANYDIDLDEVNHETKSNGKEKWYTLDHLANMGLI